MSFILDALKKAESERNRRVAPVLMDARIAPPRRHLPAWAWVLGAVLLGNLLVLGVLLLRKPATVAAQVVAPQASAPGDVPATTVTPAATTAIAPASNAAGPAASAPAPPGPAAPAAAPVMPASTLYAPPARRDDEDLPSANELRAAGVALPELQLNLHVYDPAPVHRSILLNGQRLREGEYSPDGVKLERVTPTGTVLEASGRRFRLEVGD